MFRRKALVIAVLGTALTAGLPARSATPCAQCHPKEVAGFAATPMAHSLDPAARGPSGHFTHSFSHTEFSIESSDKGMVQRLARNGHSAEYNIAYTIGSGAHAFGYLIEIDHHLFQSPLGYFAVRGWRMSPGYEDSEAPDFYRPVTPNCLFCHSGEARPVPGTYNTYQDPPFAAEAITCERCHGPAEAHLRAPVPGSIVNPAKLPPRARDSICEQCHLNGEERVPNPGKQLADFHPGQELEDVFSVYVNPESKDPSQRNPFKVVSQVQQLALSVCARQSHGKLWCGTCHDPHQLPADPKAYYRSRCLSCHGAELVKTHPKPNDDCVGCHMPRRPVTDGAHTAFTDHRISRRPLPAASSPAPAAPPASLAAWHDPPGVLANRNLGIAEVIVGERLESFPLVNQGYLSLRSCWNNLPNDPGVLTGLGTALMEAGHGAEAAAAFEQVIQIEPNVASHYLHAALAWKAAHDNAKAAAYFEKTIQLDPLLDQPYLELATIYSETHDRVMYLRTLDRYVKAFPKSIRAQTAMQQNGGSAGR